MKVLMLTHTLNTGGAERVGVNIANGLAESGWEVTVMANKKGEITYPLSQAVKLIWFPNVSNKIKRRWQIFKLLQTFLNTEKPDIVVEILHVFPHELLLARKFSTWKCPLVITEHDSFERPGEAKMPKYLYYKKWILDKAFDYVTVLTEADVKYIGSRLKNVHVMYNPLFLKPLKEIPYKEKIILSVGRLDAWHCKGFDILIKSWRKICSNYPDWKLRIIGAGNESSKAFLTQLCVECNQVEFADYTTDIEYEYKQAAIYCLSSRYEGWGLVMVEAMSQGCATIACDYKGRQAECITDGKDGVLCKPNDEEELSKSISKLIADSSFRESLQKAALYTASKYYYTEIAAEWDKFLKEVVKKNTSVS